MEGVLNRALVWWVGAVRLRARRVLIATSVVTLLLLGYAVAELGINTHHTALLSDDLQFWREYNAFAEVFPILDEALLVVVDADTSDQAREAADALAERLASQPDLYTDVYVPGGGDFFERHALLYLSVDELEDLADQLATVQPLLAEIARDRSLKNLATVLQEGIEHARIRGEAPMDLSMVFDSMSVAAEAVLQGRPRHISWTELLLDRELPGDSSRRIVVLHPILEYHRLLPARRAIDGVRDIARELELDPQHGVRVRITGNVALNTEEMVSVARSVVVGGVATFLVVGLILFGAVRSVYFVVSVLVTLLVGLIWTAAFATVTVGYLSVISIAFAILFIGLGVDFGLHFVMRYAELVRAGHGNAASLAESAYSVGGSLVLCAFTTAMGFYVFVPTDYRAVGELGLISGTGMIMSLFWSLTLLPALLTLGEDREPGRSGGGAVWLERLLIHVAVEHPRTVRLSALALGLLGVALLPSVRFDHNISKMRDPSTESVQTFDDLLADSETSPWTIDILSPSLDEADALARELRKFDFVERAVTLSDYVPEDQEEKLEILAEIGYFVPEPPGDEVPSSPLADQIAALRALRRSLEAPWYGDRDPERIASAARAAERLERFLARLETLERKREKREELALFEQSLTGSLPGQIRRLWNALEPGEITPEALPRPLVSRMLSPEGWARIQVLPSEDLGERDELAHFVDGVKKVEKTATGSAVSLLEWGRAVVRSFQQALLSAVVAVTLLLWFLWRRLDDMMLVLAPLALASILTAATAGVVGIAFNFVNVVVLPLLLGIGVDSGIHLVHRHRVAVETGGAGQSPERELLETSTAQAVYYSAVTTMASFGSLALMDHRGLASLGQLLLIGVTYTLLANLVLLPALLARKRPAADATADSAGAGA